MPFNFYKSKTFEALLKEAQECSCSEEYLDIIADIEQEKKNFDNNLPDFVLSYHNGSDDPSYQKARELYIAELMK